MDLHYGNYLQLTIIGIFTLFLITPSVNSQDSINCNNTIGEFGECINIQDCKPIIQLVKNQGISIKNFLRSFTCNTDRRNPKVCCPPVSELIYGPLFAPDCGIRGQNEEAKYLNGDYTIVGIIGGNSAKLVHFRDWPWAAAIGYKSDDDSSKIKWKCGGSLISSRHVITAAHCIIENIFVVRLGDLNLYSDDDGANPVDFAIERYKIHPNYNAKTATHDIAVLKLLHEVDFTEFIRPVCLPIFDELLNENFVGQIASVVGWGKTDLGRISEDLQETQVPVVNQDDCKKVYRRRSSVIDDNVICAGDINGEKDSCQGDSGGPLMLSINNIFHEIGVVSHGILCGIPGVPGVYTALNRHLDFIMSQLY